MTATPAGNEPNRPHTDGTLAPTAPGNAPHIRLTRAQKTVAAFVGTGTAFIAALGFAGSYSAVTAKAHTLGFGWFADWITIGVDAGIGIFLALDLLLTWLRMPYPMLRHIAWLLTGATIVFNASASWPNPLGVGMHAVIPVLFIAATEAAVGRIADITADKYMEGPPPSRWFLNPISTFILWRRQRLWGIRFWGTVLELERERRIYKGKLRKEYGRAWRRKANADQLLVLRLATKDGLSITEALELPEKEAEKQRATQQRIEDEKQAAAEKRRREAEDHRREQQRLDEEAAAKAEADRIANEREALELQKEKEDAARERILADAETQAKLAEITRRQQQADAENDRQRQQAQLAHAKAVAAEQERAAQAARQIRENEEAAARAAREKEAASRRAADIVQRATSASASPAPASRTTSASRPAASQPANAATTPAANTPAGSASAASANGASQAATSRPATNANANQTPATSPINAANDDTIQKVVDVFHLLEQQEGKAPSDARLGTALGVSRSRAQQLRTAAIEAGHTALAKPLRIAS